ncbi:hypothetical protein BB559_006540 [Furculomyces boomerangus]|uniref:Pyridoxal phosphate homeostasis protein n=2 Tax=Harpellales TaxID=61421 RepID=A0A2T9Y1Y9_9FUNG|nr:hypothetical protein BB559_006540 [Furculomyces boomerangus]PWA00644.1 hypothetical protein BB558_003302 [Smittium angustum]
MNSDLVPTLERENELIENINDVLSDVEAKKVNEARLVLVSKTKPASDIVASLKTGQLHFGENYTQELVEKAKVLPKEIKWHYIGRLQSNKCKTLAEIPNLWAVETIDGKSKAKKMNDAWAAAGNKNKLNIYVQVNTSEEPNKGGVETVDLEETLAYIMKECHNLNLLGIMTIGSVENSNVVPNPDFLKMGELRKNNEAKLGTKLELSMGMTQDFEHALELGSNNVRVGQKIFGKRAPKNVPN